MLSVLLLSVLMADPLYQEPRPTVVDIMRAINNVLTGCQSCAPDANHDGVSDILDVQLMIAAVLAPCVRPAVTVTLSDDRTSFRVVTSSSSVTFAMTAPVSGRVEVRIPSGVPNFNINFDVVNTAVLGSGWAITEGQGPQDSLPAVTMNVTAGRFDPPAFGCL